MSITKIRFFGFILLFLIFANFYVWDHVTKASVGDFLQVSFLDVGQGDSILIKAPNGVEMIIDGGRDKGVLTDLNDVMPLRDDSIDIVLATHADADHIGGLPDVLEKYKVGKIITNGNGGDTKIYKRFDEDILKEGAEIIEGKQGMRIILDEKENIYFDILYPLENTQAKDTNSLSIVGRLVYGSREFLFTGDAPQEVEQKIINFCKECLSSDVLKAGHHGSRTSSGHSFISAVAPEYAIISAGQNNSYGHPHKETIQTLENQNIKILETAKEGTITFETDGVELWRR